MTKKLERQMRVAVRRGAKALDKAVPQWFTRKYLSLTKLDMPSYHYCVYGQVSMNLFKYDHLTLGEVLDSSSPGGYYSCKLGFDLDYEKVDPDKADKDVEFWNVLHDEWRIQVTKRRELAAKV